MSEETRKILKELEVGTTYSGVDVICRQYKEIERLRKTLDEIYSLTLVIDSKIMRKEYAQANKFNHIVEDKIKELKGADKE